MLGGVAYDPLFLLGSQPMISWNPPVVLIHLSIAVTPLKIFALPNPHPPHQAERRNLRPLHPVIDVVDDLVTSVMGNPLTPQCSPSSFFSLTCSSINSETTSFFRASFSLSASFSRSNLVDGAFSPRAKRPPHSRRTASATGRKRSVGSGIRHRAARPPHAPADASLGWPLYLWQRTSCVIFLAYLSPL